MNGTNYGNAAVYIITVLLSQGMMQYMSIT